MKVLSLAAAAGLLFLTVESPVHASLLGDSVGVQYFYPNLSSPTGAASAQQTVTAGGALFTNVNGVFNVSVTGTTITASAFSFNAGWAAGAFNGFVVTDFSNLMPTFTLDPSTTMAGLTNADLIVSGNTLEVDWAGLGFNTGTVVVLDVTSPVPEPGTLVLFGSALGGLGLLKRSRKLSIR